MTVSTSDTNARVSRPQMFMQMAHVVLARSTCQRAKVGCVITDAEGTSVLSMGYNGNARGQPNSCDSTEAGKCGCIHAEVNALLKCTFHGVENLGLFTTTSPCLACAKLILNSKVTVVYVDVVYRSTEGLRLLLSAGVRVYQQQPNTDALYIVGFNVDSSLILSPQV